MYVQLTAPSLGQLRRTAEETGTKLQERNFLAIRSFQINIMHVNCAAWLSVLKRIWVSVQGSRMVAGAQERSRLQLGSQKIYTA